MPSLSRHHRCRRSKTFVNALDTRVSGRVRYEAAQQTVKSTIYAKRAVRLGPNTALNAKLELHARHKLAEEGKFAVTGGERDVQARLEMSHKVLNITDSQARPGVVSSVGRGRRGRRNIPAAPG
jgi:hypothetical protein